jgi:hypothetical protein
MTWLLCRLLKRHNWNPLFRPLGMRCERCGDER